MRSRFRPDRGSGAAGGSGPRTTGHAGAGVRGQDPTAVLPDSSDRVAAAGGRVFAGHARKAWLDGLGPKANREVPPLDYALVGRVARARPALAFILNGGIASLEQARGHLAPGINGGFAGVMLGRAAYHQPAMVLGGADALVTGSAREAVSAEAAVRAMYGYIEDELARGTRLARITRHMLGAFAGRPGARRWRRILSEGAHRPGAGVALVELALGAVAPARTAAE